jgi:hypothetical protein
MAALGLKATVYCSGCTRTRRLTAVLFGIGAIREEVQRGFVQLRCHAIGRRPDLPITNDGPVKCRLLGPAPVVDPSSDTAGRRLVLDAAANLRVVKTLQDAL